MADDFEITFEGENLEELGAKLLHAAERYEREMTPTLAVIGKQVSEMARAIAASESEKVAATIESHTVPGAAVIAAGDDATPIAKLWELGNRGSRRSADTFRHPVFGNKNVWVQQQKFPYLTAALRLGRRDITKQLEHAWNRVLHLIESGT